MIYGMLVKQIHTPLAKQQDKNEDAGLMISPTEHPRDRQDRPHSKCYQTRSHSLFASGLFRRMLIEYFK